MSDFRSWLASSVDAMLHGEFSSEVVYNGSTIRGILRRGKSAVDGTGFGSEGSSTNATLRVSLADVPEPAEGDVVSIGGESWSVAREVSRTLDTALLEVRADRSAFGGRQGF